MIRTLVIIIIAGFVMSLACISAAVAIGGPEAISRSAWSWSWDWDHDGEHRFGGGPHMARVTGPETERDFPWSGGDRLEVNAPAEVDYVQAPGPAKLTIRGSRAALDRVRVENGRINLTSGMLHGSGLHITLTAPDVKRFALNGADELKISGYKQETLELSASGHAQIEAQGEVKSVTLRVSGAADADLGDLKATRADVDISGAGQATINPTDWARISISGMGDVDLVTRPKQLETHISGAGHISQPGQDSVTAGDSDDDDAGRGPARPT